ncbi:transglycosylase SLT domain-containing protein [Kitasatospora sp. NPDC093679]|uniref:transglycosylase SLT domain-containing protein n=1 Tax=Kitasatospora sp. NPDC093679 TaxID=3154983 RepID=UPI00341F5F6B
MPKHARPRRVPAVLLSGRWITTAALATAAVAVTTANAAPSHSSGAGTAATARSRTPQLEPTAWSTHTSAQTTAAAHRTNGAVPAQRTGSHAKHSALPTQRSTGHTHTAAHSSHTAPATTAPATTAPATSTPARTVQARTTAYPTAPAPTTTTATATATATHSTTTPTASATPAATTSTATADHTSTRSWSGNSPTARTWTGSSGSSTWQAHSTYGSGTGATQGTSPSGTASPSTAATAPATAATAAPTTKATGDLDSWINQALAVMAENHIPGTYDGIYRNIMRESSGNPQAINLTDSNAAAGHPSKGLLQVIDPTFQAYHVPGTSTDIYDPVANITAACNYAAHFYGSIDNVNGPY